MRKNIFFIASLLFLSLHIYCQKTSSQIEINPFVRFDNYPTFSYHYNGRYTTDYLKMKGTNYGITLCYKYSLKKHLFIKAGLGYFKYSFNKLDNTNSLSGKSQVRPINFISPLFIQYSTDKYHYNNLMICTGIEKEVDLNKGVKVVTSLNLNTYYTFSQYYHLAFNPFDGNLNYNKKRGALFGFSGTLSTSITKQINRFQIGPSIILPIFDSWKKDPVFLEEGYDGGKNKWLNGIGVGIVCNILLHKN